MSVDMAPGVSVLADLSRHGSAGVGFFFVLSGFIILYAHGDDIGRPDRLPRYVRNRFVRVFPAYWLYTALFVAAVVIFNGSTALPQTVAGWFSTWSLVRVSAEATPLSVAWTLFYEIAFYMLFAALIVSRRIGLVVLGIWALAVVATHDYADRHDPIGVWTSILCLNFFVGMGACWLHSRMNPLAGVLALALGVGGLIFAGLQADSGLSRTLFELSVALGCGLVIAGASAIERVRPLWFGPLAAIGDASYSLYLVHQHIQGLIKDLLQRIGLAERLSPDALFVLVIALGAGVAYLIYRVVERPLVSALRPRAGKEPWAAAWPAGRSADNR